MPLNEAWCREGEGRRVQAVEDGSPRGRLCRTERPQTNADRATFCDSEGVCRRAERRAHPVVDHRGRGRHGHVREPPRQSASRCRSLLCSVPRRRPVCLPLPSVSWRRPCIPLSPYSYHTALARSTVRAPSRWAHDTIDAVARNQTAHQTNVGQPAAPAAPALVIISPRSQNVRWCIARVSLRPVFSESMYASGHTEPSPGATTSGACKHSRKARSASSHEPTPQSLQSRPPLCARTRGHTQCRCTLPPQTNSHPDAYDRTLGTPPHPHLPPPACPSRGYHSAAACGSGRCSATR